MKRRAIIITLVVLILLGIIAALYFSGVFTSNSKETTIPEGSQSLGNVIEYQGKKYTYNTDLTNILFLGIDTGDTLNKFTNPAHAGQSDAIFLLTLNNKTGEASILQINRNSMTDIDIYDTSGQVMETIPGQVTLQYAYGIGGTQSCWAAKQTISEMLYNVPIDGYFVMNLEAISTINDAIGGVDVTIPQDYTVIDTSMTKGSTVHLMGDVSERFVRYRDHSQFNSVADRMDRQVIYVTALIEKLRSRGGQEMYDILKPYLDDIVITNLSPEDFNTFAKYGFKDCRVDYIPGEMVDTDMFEEYNIDQEALEKYIVDNYYIPVNE